MTAYQFNKRVPPGSLLKKPLPEPRAKLKLDKAKRDKDPDYLALIRKLPCVNCGLDPCGEAAHVRMASAVHGKRAVGMGEKPDDKWSVPLCRGCHREDPDAQHKVGELPFWHAVGLNPLLVCEGLQAAAPDLVRMRAVVFEAVASRPTERQS